MIAAPLFWGGSCSISAVHCTDDCDPCFESCHCEHAPCAHPLVLGGPEALRLEGREIAVEELADGTIVTTNAPAIAPASARGATPAPGRARLEPSDLVRVADPVVGANRDRFGAPREWRLDAVDASPASTGSTVVLLERVRGSRALAFLFDREGMLLEIVDHLVPAHGEPR